MSADAHEAVAPAADQAAAVKTCLGCGYRLDHLTTNACPECGRAFDPVDPRTFGPRHPEVDPRWMALFAVPAVTYFGCTFGLTPLVRGWLPSYTISTTTTPWYFIVQDVGIGLALVPMLVIGFGVAYAIRHRNRWMAFMLCWMSAIWSLGLVAKSLIILMRCRNFFTPASATAPWSSFDAYLWDPILLGAQYGSLGLILGCLGLMTPRLRRWRQENLARTPR